MKISILTEAGEKIGFGHLTRCLSLAQGFLAKGSRVQMFVQVDETVKGFLPAEMYQDFAWRDNPSDLWERLKGEDIIVIDSYLADLAFYQDISKKVKQPVYLDDNKRLDYPPGVIVNGMIYAHELGYPMAEGYISLLGTPYALLRKEFWNVPVHNIRGEVKNILVTFGGLIFEDLALKIKETLEGHFHVSVLVIDPRQKRLSAAEIKQCMYQSDLCISGGGQTLFELARVGLPTIGICLAQNQKFNLEAWHKAGVVEFIGWHHDKALFQSLIEAVKKFLPQAERLRRSQQGQSYVDGKGSFRVAQELVNICSHTQVF